MEYRHLLFLFPIAVTLHNLEEAIFLPRWSPSTRLKGSFARSRPAPAVFRFGAALLAGLTFLLAWLSAGAGKQAMSTYVPFGFMVAMLTNAVVPHLAGCLIERRYNPGLVTAAAINLPLLPVLIACAWRGGYVTGWKAIGFAIATPLLLLCLIAILFRLGTVRGN